MKASKKAAAKGEKAQILDPESMVETPSKALGGFFSIDSDSDDAPPAKKGKGSKGVVKVTTPKSKGAQSRQVVNTPKNQGSKGQEHQVVTPEPAGPGRKAAPLYELADELWKTLRTADESSLFFGDRAIAQQRSLLRYASLAGQKLSTEKDAHLLAKFELARKKFQVMDSLVKMFLVGRSAREVNLRQPFQFSPGVGRQ